MEKTPNTTVENNTAQNLQEKVGEHLKKLTNEQKQKLGEQTIENQDIINFGKGTDEERNNIVKKTKTAMDVLILMIMHYDIQRQAPNYREDIFFKFEYDENNIKILQNIIEATTIYMDITDNEQKRIILINKYNQIIERIKRKFEGNITKNTEQTNKEIRNILANQQNSENGETIHENNDQELYSGLYNKIRECAKHEFIKICKDLNGENTDSLIIYLIKGIDLLLKNEEICGDIAKIMEEYDIENDKIREILIRYHYDHKKYYETKKLVNQYRKRAENILKKYKSQEDKIKNILKNHEEIVRRYNSFFDSNSKFSDAEKRAYQSQYRERILKLIEIPPTEQR